ncbi:MAG: DUF642 domain-containing protein [Bacillota bacterium]|jgi:hypothetical protein|nr:DUF642 domain-containing protein [Bacillota bacterium]MDI9414642.1 DUF642 domain-containing protein [Bacillota bacterium]NLD12244.1 DUF642 domain-containing protein [Bacillota bacterium]HOB88001.1 DUF642 domain-containing protein [Bacillota bacterium]HOJ57012.1 DUF642 domain-containing protein [Bacillota bacterium]
MSTSEILSVIADEEESIASILSAEAVKAAETARWITLITDEDLEQLTPNEIIGSIVQIQRSVSCVLSSAAEKEIAIAAKLCALLGTKCGPIIWKVISRDKCLPCPEEQCPSTGDVIINGDFEDTGSDPEDPQLVGWDVVNAEPRVRNGEPVSTVFSGNVVAVLGSPNTSQDASISQTVPVNGGCPYQLTFAASGNPAGPTLSVQVEFFSNGSISTFNRVITTLGQGYHTYVYVLDTPENATSATITFIKEGAGESSIDLVTFGSQ